VTLEKEKQSTDENQAGIKLRRIHVIWKNLFQHEHNISFPKKILPEK